MIAEAIVVAVVVAVKMAVMETAVGMEDVAAVRMAVMAILEIIVAEEEMILPKKVAATRIMACQNISMNS